MQNSAVELLGKLPMFGVLSVEELQSLAAIAVPRRFASGETLFLEGEPCEGQYVIASGSVRIVKTTPSGRQILLAIERAPGTVAEVPIFDGGPYPATVVAAEDTTTLLIFRKEFQALCLRNPQVSLKLLAVTGRRLRGLVNLLEGVTFGSVRQRLAQLLVEESAQHPGQPFALPGTHEELASRVGTVREVVSRNLSRFQAEGLLRVERRMIRVLDEAGLRREAETEL